MKILFFGDVVGKPGRLALKALAPKLRAEYAADVVMANLENIAHGKGLTRETFQDILDAGVDIGTGGNHTFAKPEANEIYADEQYQLVRPLNLPAGTAGKGQKTFQVGQKKVVVLNLLGQFGMHPEPVDSPFPLMQRLRPELPADADAIIVDFHAEATSEKVNMGWLLDGYVSAVIGTHTHVPTADARILPKGTAYITDVGMVGLTNSSLGVDKDLALQRFLTEDKVHFDIPEHGEVTVSAVLIDITDSKATGIERIERHITV